MARRSGLTLIEILVALTLVVMVMGVVYVLYDTVVRVQEFQNSKSQPLSKTAHSLHTLSADLNNSVYVSDDRCTFRIAESNGWPAVSFCATLHEEDEHDLRWHGLIAVRYFIQTEPSPTLIRTRQPLTGPGSLLPAVTNQLLSAVSSFSIEAYDQESWSSEWEVAEYSKWPQAAKVRLSANEEDAEITQVNIPFGTIVESSIERQQATGSPSGQ